MKNDQNFDLLRRFFTTVVAAFEIQYTLGLCFGYSRPKNRMHLLCIDAMKEAYKQKPDMNKIKWFIEKITSQNENQN